MLEIPNYPASNARHVVSHADLGEHRKSAPPPASTVARHLQAASSSQQPNSEFNRFRADGLAHLLATRRATLPGSTRRWLMFSPKRTVGSVSQSSSMYPGSLLVL